MSEHDEHVINSLVAENADLKAQVDRLRRMLANANEQRESRNAELDALSLKASDNTRLQKLLEVQAKVNRALSEKAAETPRLSFNDAVKIAVGCLDYGGGYNNNDGKREAFHHGIETVATALKAALSRGLADTQVAALYRMGSAAQP